MIFERYIKESSARAHKFILDESVEDFDRRCEFCDTLLNDMGTCPKCDEGEEDYGDKDTDIEESLKDDSCAETVTEELSVRDKLTKAFPGVFSFDPNYDPSSEVISEDVQITETMSNKEKLVKAFPGVFSFDDSEVIQESRECVTEAISAREKLERAFPDVSFNWEASQDVDTPVVEEMSDEYSDYDDDYDIDDVEQDRIHSSLYGGDRMYCDCGAKLVMDEWGGYCPHCDAEEAEKLHQMSMFDDDVEDA